VGKPERRKPFRRTRRRWDNIKEGFKEIEWNCVDWFDLAADRVKWWAVENRGISLWVP
jgi:hypothetical protein